MDDDDKLEMLNRVLRSWAGTWWEVVVDKVKTYKVFQTRFLAQYWNVQVQRRFHDYLVFENTH